MIRLTRLNGQTLYVNAELIQQIEPIPDTLITLTSGAKLIVRETAEDIVKEMTYNREVVHSGAGDGAISPGGSLTHALEGVLVSEFRTLQELVTVAKQQRASLGDRETKGLTSLLEKERDLLSQLSSLEEQRKKLCITISAQIPMAQPTDSVKDLLPCLGDEHRAWAENLLAGMRALAEERREIDRQIRCFSPSRLEPDEAAKDVLGVLVDPGGSRGPDGDRARSV